MEEIEFLRLLKRDLLRSTVSDRWRPPDRVSTRLAVIAVLIVAAASAGAGRISLVASADTPQQALLQSILGGMNTDLTNAAIVQPPAGMVANPGTEWLSVTVPTTLSPPDHVKATWEAMPIAGAYNARASSADVEPLAGWTISDPTGSSQDTFNEVADVTAPGRSTSAIDTLIRSNLATVGLRPLSITFEQPDGPAPVVVAQTTDPAGFMAAGHTTQDIFGTLNYPGTYLQVIDMSGNTVFAARLSTYTHGGTSWTQPAHDSTSALGATTPARSR